MRFLTADQWDSLGIDEPAFRLFYERWNELLDVGVPLTHRASIMGPLAILRELVELQHRYADSAYGKSDLTAVEQEAFGVTVQPYGRVEGTVLSDEIVADTAAPLLEQRGSATKHFIVGGAPPPIASARKRVGLKQLVDKVAPVYLKRVTQKLEEAIFVDGNTPATITRIDALASALVSELLSRGHADSFLRTHTRMLEKGPGRPEEERNRFRSFCDRLLQDSEPVHVIFRIQGTSRLWDNWPADMSSPTEAPNLPDGVREDKEFIEFADSSGNVRFVAIDIDAPDHHAATRSAYRYLQRHIDLSFIRHATDEPKILDVATFRGEGRQLSSLVTGRKLELDSVPSPKTAQAREQDQAQIAAALRSANVADPSKRRLAGALRYYRISIGQSWLESSFTNLWTALEVLASSGYSDNVIERVVRSVVPILAGNKVRELTDGVLGYLLGIGVHRDPEFRRKFGEVYRDGWIQPELLLGCLATRDRAGELCRRYRDDSPLICRRVFQLHHAVASGKRVARVVYRTTRRIEWQIRRLYRLRNNVIHGAALTVNAKRLLSHLQIYVYDTLLVEGLLLAADNALDTIEAVVAAVDTAFHAWLETIRDTGDVSEADPHVWRGLYTPPSQTLLP